MHRRHRLSALAVAALALGLSACGSETHTYSPGSLPSQSPSPSPSVTAPAAVTPGPVSAADREALSARMHAALAKARTAHINWAAGGLSAAGDISFGGKESLFRATFGGFGPYTFEGIVVGSDMYVSLDGLMELGTYYRVPAGDVVTEEAYEQSKSLDPDRLPDTLREAGADLRLVGIEELHGEPLTHYRSKIDFSAVKALVREHPEGVPDRVDFHFWLDDQALFRRVEIRCGCVDSWTEFSDWGKAVDIHRPPAEAIVPRP